MLALYSINTKTGQCCLFDLLEKQLSIVIASDKSYDKILETLAQLTYFNIDKYLDN